MKTARQTAFEALKKIVSDSGFSNLVINNALRNTDLNQRDKAFVSALVYGVVERAFTLDYIIEKNSTKPIFKLDIPILTILRMGVYQIYFMRTVTDSAAVDESVKLAKYAGLYRASGFVNAVLRSCIRNFDFDKAMSSIKDRNEYLSIKYSCPLWLVDMWTNDMGEEKTEAFLQRSVGKPPVFARVNTLKTDTEELVAVLNSENIKAEPDSLFGCIVLDSFADYENCNAFKNGMFHIQDKSSQLCVKYAGIKPGDTVIDVCSAPGGKAFTAAQYLNGRGRLLAFDLHENRVRLIQSGADRLGINLISCGCRDASKFDSTIPKADVVLCDVVCSGFGIIRRKPEIKYKKQEDILRLPDIQYNILLNSSRYVKKGGTLIYSTCTVNNKENREVVRRFLDTSDNFETVLPTAEEQQFLGESADGCITLFGDDNNCDGFFMCKMKKVR